jgi:hypothetical protein
LARDQHRHGDVTTHDGVPEEQLMDQVTNKKTVELCADERDRMRCVRHKGHAGPHECLNLDGPPKRWL